MAPLGLSSSRYVNTSTQGIEDYTATSLTVAEGQEIYVFPAMRGGAKKEEAKPAQPAAASSG
eukprot:12255250-Alexandrium_andersonii.AAC.1